MTGPYASEEEARHAADAAGLPNRDILIVACKDAGLVLGDWDKRIIEWLAGWERATAVSVAGLIHRAYLTGFAAGYGVPARALGCAQRARAEEMTADDVTAVEVATPAPGPGL